jgi:hypothetical protein
MTHGQRGGTDEATSRREKEAAKNNSAGMTVDCVRCGRALPPTAFGANTRKRNGLNSWCNACQVARTQQWREENRDALNERRRAWWAEHRDQERTRRAELAARHLHEQRTRAQQELSRILRGDRSRAHSTAVSAVEPRRSAGGRVVLPASPAGASPMNVAQER